MIKQVETIFQNQDFVIISKPAGLSFHSDGLHTYLRSILSCEIYGVHRLDKVTSGLLIFAKSSDVASALSKKFESREMKKVYIALSDKRPSKKQGMIKGDMEKTRDGCYKLTRNLKNPALTRFISESANEQGIRLFRLFPETGKTHQLRVAMKSLGSPIIGDDRYGGSESDRTYLHAYELSFNLNDEDFNFQVLPVGSLWPSSL